MKAIVNANLFEIAARFVSKEETRYYLNGVYVEPHPVRGVRMTSTDGHRLVSIWDERGTCGGHGIVQLSKAALSACKAKRNTVAVLVLEPTVSGQASATVRSLEVPKYADRDATRVEADYDKWPISAMDPICLIDGTFPAYMRVVPSTVTAGVGGYNPNYVADFAKASQDLGTAVSGEKSAAPISICGDGSGPAMVTFPSRIAFGVLMPMRGEFDTAPPAWHSATRYEKPPVHLAHMIGSGDTWRFTISTTLNSLDPAVTRIARFDSERAAVRAWNRLVTRLRREGRSEGLETRKVPDTRVPDIVEASEANHAATFAETPAIAA